MSIKRECYESRKNIQDEIWLNPKSYNDGQSATKPAREGSTTRPREGRTL